MRFEQVEVEDDGAEAIVQLVLRSSSIFFRNMDFPTNIPILTKLGDEIEERCIAVWGGDGEPLRLEVDHTPDGSRISFIGQLATGELQRDSLNNEATNGEMEELDRAFDEWAGPWGTFLKVDLAWADNKYETSAEVAMIESHEEFEKYSGNGKAVFEDRPAKLDAPEPVLKSI